MLVVDPPAITQRALRVEHDALGRARHAERVGDAAIEVLDERELDPLFHRLRRHLRDRVVRTGIHRDELYALVAVVALEALQHGQVLRRGRAAAVDEDQDISLLYAKVAQTTGEVANVLEAQIANRGADLHLRLRGGGGGSQHQGKEK